MGLALRETPPSSRADPREHRMGQWPAQPLRTGQLAIHRGRCGPQAFLGPPAMQGRKGMGHLRGPTALTRFCNSQRKGGWNQVTKN